MLEGHRAQPRSQVELGAGDLGPWLFSRAGRMGSRQECPPTPDLQSLGLLSGQAGKQVPLILSSRSILVLEVPSAHIVYNSCPFTFFGPVL